MNKDEETKKCLKNIKDALSNLSFEAAVFDAEQLDLHDDKEVKALLNRMNTQLLITTELAKLVLASIELDNNNSDNDDEKTIITSASNIRFS